MYRLVMYYLMLLLGVAFILSFFNLFSFTPWELLLSTFILTMVCWFTNEGLAKVFGVTTNIESSNITAFILALIINPVAWNNFFGLSMIVLAALVAMASKYVLTTRKKHIFNPAALAVAVTGVLFGAYASWWVGGAVLFPLVLIGGVLIVRKIQRFDLFWSFAVIAVLGIAYSFLPTNPLTSIWQTVLHSSLLFCGTIMLTEPLTSPHTRIHRVIYGALVGFLFIPGIHIASFYFSPEIALLIGNIYAYVAQPNSRRTLTLKEAKQVADNVWDFSFIPERPLAFNPGQYMEWTLGHMPVDMRGNRRYFTIASSPTEKELHLGIKTYEPSSTFKKALLALKPGDTMSVGELSGDFTLPRDPHKKLAFIAGGIGITPFRSMVQYMIDENQKRDAVLLYSTKTADEVAYKQTFDAAEHAIGMKTHYTRSLDIDTLMREVPDYKERMFYLSGPRGMVVAFQKTLKELGVPRRNIKIDFFPGFA